MMKMSIYNKFKIALLVLGAELLALWVAVERLDYDLLIMVKLALFLSALSYLIIEIIEHRGSLLDFFFDEEDEDEDEDEYAEYE